MKLSPFVIALLLLPLLGLAYPTPDHHFPFDQNYTDIEGGLEFANTQDSPLNTTSRIGNGSVILNGTSNGLVETPNPIGNNPINYTVSMWIRPYNVGQNVIQLWEIGDQVQGSGSDEVDEAYILTNTTIFRSVHDPDTTPDDGGDTSGTIGNSTWYHVTMVRMYDADLLFYVDGVLVQNDSTDAGLDDGYTWADKFIIGDLDQGGRSLRGHIDDLKIWTTRALNQSDITDLAAEITLNTTEFYLETSVNHTTINSFCISAPSLGRNCTTSGSIAITNITTGDYNVTYHNITHNGIVTHQNITSIHSINYSVSTSYTETRYAWQARATVGLYDVDGDPVSNPRNYTNNLNTSTGYLYLINGSNQNINVSAIGWFPTLTNATGQGLLSTSTHEVHNLTNARVRFFGGVTGDEYYPTCTIDGLEPNTTNTDYFALKDGDNTFVCTDTVDYPAFSSTVTKPVNQTVESNITLTEYDVSIQFDANVTGIIFWGSQNETDDTTTGGQRGNFSETDLVNSTVNYCGGNTSCYVTITFNDEGVGEQNYEFYNTPETTHSAEVHVLTDMSEFLTVQVVTLGENPLADAVVTVKRLTDSGGGDPPTNETYELIGRRFTTDEGFTTFYLDNEDIIEIFVRKNGYELYHDEFAADEHSNTTQASPYKITLHPADVYNVDDTTFHLKSKYYNESFLYFWAYSDEYDTLQLSSDYNTDVTLLNIDPDIRYSATAIHRCPQITRECYYLWGNFTFYVKDESGNTLKEINVTWLGYDGHNETRVFNEISLDSSDTAPIILFVVLILLSAFIGTQINTEEGGAGFTTFMIGTIFLAVLNATFIFPAAIAVIYYVSGYIFQAQEA